VPGQSIRDEIIDVIFDRWLSPVIWALFLWMLVAVEWIRFFCRIRPSWTTCIGLTFLTIVGTLHASFKFYRATAYLKNLRQGMEGEIAVGQFLDEYCREKGYKVLHDLKGDGFNVDHVVIGRSGVFTLETKTISKPAIGEPIVTYDGESVLVDGFKPDRDPVAQAKACARHVAELLAESTNRDIRKIFVRPVVLYPGWYIKGSSSGREVWVLEPKALLSFLEHETIRLTNEDVGLFHSHLKTRNRRE